MTATSNEHATPVELQGIRKTLVRIRRIKSFFGNLYRFSGDWFLWISWTATIAAPFGFAAILYLPDQRDTIGLSMLLLTGIGTVLLLTRTLFKMDQIARGNIRQMAIAEELINKIDTDAIEPSELIAQVKQLRLFQLDEPEPGT
jgi:hypothetical protein